MKQSGEPVGSWYIHSKSDAMTDELSCVAYFKDEPQIQLTPDSLAVTYRGRGGIEGYRLRFDDQEASGLLLPSSVERRIGAIILRDNVFERIRSSRRLRIQGVTLISGMANDDIDLTDAGTAISKMTQMGCK